LLKSVGRDRKFINSDPISAEASGGSWRHQLSACELPVSSLLPFPGAAGLHDLCRRATQMALLIQHSPPAARKTAAATKRTIGGMVLRMLMYLTLSRLHREIVSTDEY
jgi:hypothetical protein